jgi:hypothetical protein
MYGFALVCGWGLTAAVIALVWINSRPGRGLPVGLLIGAVAGLLWPITLWVAVGAWLYRRANSRASTTALDPESLDAQARQAEAFARQAELENMPTSAEYWRAEVQRLQAQRQNVGSATARPASTGLIVLGCTVASLASLGAIGLTTPSVSAQPSANGSGPVASPPLPTGPAISIPAPVVAQPQATRSKTYTYRVEGNYRATQLGYTASNGDAIQLNNTGNINTAGSALPWTLTVDAEPNGGLNYLNASTLSTKGDSLITCTIVDDAGNVVVTETGRGAYASCFASTMGLSR